MKPVTCNILTTSFFSSLPPQVYKSWMLFHWCSLPLISFDFCRGPGYEHSSHFLGNQSAPMTAEDVLMSLSQWPTQTASSSDDDQEDSHVLNRSFTIASTQQSDAMAAGLPVVMEKSSREKKDISNFSLRDMEHNDREACADGDSEHPAASQPSAKNQALREDRGSPLSNEKPNRQKLQQLQSQERHPDYGNVLNVRHDTCDSFAPVQVLLAHRRQQLEEARRRQRQTSRDRRRRAGRQALLEILRGNHRYGNNQMVTMVPTHPPSTAVFTRTSVSADEAPKVQSNTPVKVIAYQQTTNFPHLTSSHLPKTSLANRGVENEKAEKSPGQIPSMTSAPLAWEVPRVKSPGKLPPPPLSNPNPGPARISTPPSKAQTGQINSDGTHGDFIVCQEKSPEIVSKLAVPGLHDDSGPSCQEVDRRGDRIPAESVSNPRVVLREHNPWDDSAMGREKYRSVAFVIDGHGQPKSGQVIDAGFFFLIN